MQLYDKSINPLADYFRRPSEFPEQALGRQLQRIYRIPESVRASGRREPTVNRSPQRNCYVKWIPARAGYPAAVQIKSYDDPKSESYPSLFIQAAAPGDDLAAVRGRPLDASIYLTDAASGDVWHTAATAPAKLVITNSDDSGRVVGEITTATLVQVSTQKTSSASGSFDGRTSVN